METKPTYQFTVLTAEPPAQDMTLVELQLLKTQWLATYGDKIADSLDIVRELGEKKDLPYPWCDTFTGKVYKAGSVTIELYEHDNAWLVGKDRYNHVITLNVFVGRHQVIAHRQDDAGTPFDSYIVPGAWLDVLVAPLKVARDLMFDREQEEYEAARAKLAKQLLIGVSV